MKKNERKMLSAKKQHREGTSASAKPEQSGKSNLHNRDISSKDIFGNPVLCAQFLRDNFNIPILKNVQPEDIEDISERYHPYLGTEFESDSVKKIRILDINKEKHMIEGVGEIPAFFVSLIDHKSFVDYDVSMQLLRYMMCIWTEYKREMEAEQNGITRLKSFRYPVIIPIVYFEGKAAWTAARNFRERIGGSDEFQKWIPDFRYELVRIHDYSNQELLERKDEMSLLMLINKIQDPADLEQFVHIPADQVEQIVRHSPEHVVDALVSAVESLCFKIDASAEERTECVRKVRERNMGYLWENMDKMSIQEERRKTEAQRKLTEKERQKTEAERQKAEAERQKAETERQRAETERQKAETERQRAEAEHQKAETERQRAEAEHQKAETEHQRAEEQQKLAEEMRKRAEEAEAKLREAEDLIKHLQGKNS